MADRTTAGLFEKIFTLLAKNPTNENKAIAKKIWPLRLKYDFSSFQMYCDSALIKLGLAKKVGKDIVQYEGEDVDNGE